jgi:hypothetical protein
MSLLDDIRAARKLLNMPRWVTNTDNWASHTAQICEILRGTPLLPVFAIDPVAHAYFEASEQEYWDLEHDFPPLIPPCELAWFEYALPQRIHSAAKGDFDIARLHSNGRVGLLMIGSARESVRDEAIPPEVRCILSFAMAPAVRWILTFELFIDYGGGDIQGSHGTIHIAADGAGKIVDRPWMQTFVRPDLTKHIPPLIPFTHPALLAFSVVHPPAEKGGGHV